MAVQSATYDGLKDMLHSAVQSVQWTYIIFWQFCPQQRVLEWGDGCYNGAIKTRKMVQAMKVISMEEAALSRSEQLRELYESLASGEQQETESQQETIRRPSVALSPEDLTEAEWFYLVCGSFSFRPGVGLVGNAYSNQQHSWLTSAHEADSKVFTRAILAKSAYIQTVICIPLLNGVVELGTTEKVEETNEFIQHVKRFFMIGNDMNTIFPPPKPALSSHSSNTILSSHQKPDSMDEDDDDDDDDEDDVENVLDEEDENGLDFVKETYDISSFQEPRRNKTTMVAIIETNELLQRSMSPDINFESPNDGTNNLDPQFTLLATSLEDSYRAVSTPGWSDNFELHNQCNNHLKTAELAPEDTRYSHTVSTIIHNQSTRWSDSHNSVIAYPDEGRASQSTLPFRKKYTTNSVYSTQSSFTTWTSMHGQSHNHPTTSQRLLKYMLFTVPFLHSNTNTNTVDVDASESVASRLRKSTSHEELSANHVLAERRRREKLNERFMTLRTLVPLVTKMDKASILGDTIEYVKQLLKKIQDLKASTRLYNSKRKAREVEGGVGVVQVEVSIIENDALVEVQCRNREGLLLDVMNKLRELGVEVTTVQSCVDAGMFTAEMRAKVKMRKGYNGKKISITLVKKAINQIISL